MELKDIQEKLEALLQGTERKIVFWYDEDAAYEEDIQQLSQQLSETIGSKLWVLSENNWFETKLLLEVQDTVSSYVVYAPFAKPEDRDNFLADTFYYSEHFYSDKMAQLCTELGIPVEYQEEVKRFRKFWTVANTKKFQSFQFDEYNKMEIDLAILCVLAGIKTCNFEELMRKVLLAGFENNSILKRFVSHKIETVFWNMCERQYGYKDLAPTLRKLMVTVLVTYTDTFAEGKIPKEWKSFLSGKQNDIIVFVKNLMNHDETKEFYDRISEEIGNELNVKRLVTEMTLDAVLTSDSFAAFDDNLMHWMLAKMEDGMLDECISGMSIPEICESRMKNCYHFSSRYQLHYCMLYNAYKVLKEASLHTYSPNLEAVIVDYTENTWQIDTWYRKFYYYMDKVGMDESVEKLRDLVENMYTNKYLADFSYKWNQSLSEDQYQSYLGHRQEDFYRSHVEPFMREGGREGRVVVIISDAFRYECAKELQKKLDLDEKCDAKMKYMLSVLPSETTLGMAALMPHKEIVIKEKLDVYVDDMKCGNSIIERRKILQSVVTKSDCLDFDTVKNAKQAEIREMFQDKELIYIYQNQIDDRGESRKSENEVFNACEEAIEEIQMMIRRLTGYVSVTRFLVTADHGFIYKRDKLPESDKISLDKSEVVMVNKRYLLSYEKINSDAVISRTLSYLSKLNNMYVTTPMGADIIKAPGGGQNYVHGGSSLQEMIIPVVKVNTLKGKQETSMVNVEIANKPERITDIVVYLEFMQMEQVTDTKKPRKLVAYFTNKDGEKISYEVPMIADSINPDPRHRLLKEKFILKSGNYRRGEDYYLVLADMENEKQEHHKYHFSIDIAGV